MKECWQINVQRCSSKPVTAFWGALYLREKVCFGRFFKHFLRHRWKNVGKCVSPVVKLSKSLAKHIVTVWLAFPFHSLQIRVGYHIYVELLPARNPGWQDKLWFAKYDESAVWLDDLKPAFGESQFFWEKEMDNFGDAKGSSGQLHTDTVVDYENMVIPTAQFM